MAYAVKAYTGAKCRRTSSIAIIIVGLLSCAAVVLGVYNLIEGKYLFTVSYLIAAFLGITYVVIRYNTVYKTYLAVDKRSIYMRRWLNKFMPYKFDCKLKLIREFIPDKTELIEIPMKDIESVYIGTKNFIKRNAKQRLEFADEVERFEKSKDFTVKRTVQKLDIFYLETTDGETAYMPITEFNVSAVIKIMKYLNRKKPDTQFFIYSKEYKRFKPLEAPKSRFNEDGSPKTEGE